MRLWLKDMAEPAAVVFPLFVFLIVVACQSNPGPAFMPNAPAVKPGKQVCIPLKVWSNDQQDTMRREFDALSPDAIMRDVFKDYIAMRDAARACAASQE